VGVAVDFSRAGAARAEMQSALDGAALMLSKDATGLNSTELQTRATQYFNSLFNRPEVAGLTVTPTYNAVNSTYTLKVTAAGQIDGTFSRVLGVNTLSIGGSSEVTWGIKKLELALALDNTGSMAANNKMTELKKAAKGLLDTLYKAAKSTGDNMGATWINWTDWEAAPANSTPDPNLGPGSACPYSVAANGFECNADPSNGSSTTATIPASGAYTGYVCPSPANGRYYNGCYNSAPTTTVTNNSCTGSHCSCPSGSGNCSCSGNGSHTMCTWTVTTTGAPYTHNWIANAHSTSNACIFDRDQDNDVLDTTPVSGTPSTLFPAHQAQICPTSLMPLSDILSNWTPTDLTALSPSSALGQKINAMTPNGNTNVTIGLAWGWHALTSSQPLTEGSAPQPDLDKVLILLTDGDNTQNRFSSTQSAIDVRTQKVCDNAKAANIKVYTIRVLDGNAGLLQSCATKTDMYYDVQQASQLNTVFGQIATNLASLRIAK
jgi:Flp pilus assembly protein TadG